MARIGIFKRNDDGFIGTIDTLMLRQHKLVIFPAPAAENENAPDYRVLSETNEIGAGWKRKSDKAGDYIALVIDDPSFIQPLRANLFTTTTDENTLHLIWTRSARRSERT